MIYNGFYDFEAYDESSYLETLESEISSSIALLKNYDLGLSFCSNN